MSNKPVVLFVDDEENVRSLVHYNLKLDGFKVLLAENGVEGLAMARKHLPDLILLDVMMPEKDGLEMLVDLKDDSKTANITVIKLTARSKVGDMEKSYSLGADHYIGKPFDPEKLGQILRRKLRLPAK